MDFNNYTVRKGKFDAGHRVMHERFKCFNVHGHEYHYELRFAYRDAASLGYAIDFKEIKRIACAWIDERFDHAFVANPKDTVLIEACKQVGSALFTMHLVDSEGFCNPSAENIAKEIFFAVSELLNNDNLKLTSVKLNETVNCFVECNGLSASEWGTLFRSELMQDVIQYKVQKGTVDYDARTASDQ